MIAVPRPEWKLPPKEESPLPRLKQGNIVAKWNALESQLAEYVTSLSSFPDEPFRFDGPQIVQLFLDQWERLEKDDTRNIGLDEVATLFELSDHQRQQLEKAGIRDMRGLAHLVNASPRIERYNQQVEKTVPRLNNMTDRVGCLFAYKSLFQRPVRILEPAPVKLTMSAKDIEELRATIGATLQRNAPGQTSRQESAQANSTSINDPTASGEE